MRVLESDGFVATCERRGDRRRVSLALIGEVAIGDHVLVHVDTALRVLDQREAELVDDAIRGLEAAASGEPLDGFFADLDREPALPLHLRGDR